MDKGFDWLSLLSTIFLAGSLIVAMWTYYASKKSEIESKAMLIYLQIIEIETGIEYMRKHCLNKNGIDPFKMYESKNLFNFNAWEQSKHLFLKKIELSDYMVIDKFYDNAQILLEEQKRAKKIVTDIFAAKQEKYYNFIQDGIIADIESNKSYYSKFSVETGIPLSGVISEKSSLLSNSLITPYIPVQIKNIINNTLAEYNKITDGKAFNNFKKKYIKIK